MSEVKTPVGLAIEAMKQTTWTDRRTLYRAIVALPYDLFEPQATQIQTKVNVREHTHRLLNWMQQHTSKVKPGQIEDEKSYMLAWRAVLSLDRPGQRCIMYAIIDSFLQGFNVKSPDKNMVTHNQTCLMCNLESMHHQHMANMTGWKYTGEYYPMERIKRAKRAGLTR